LKDDGYSVINKRIQTWKTKDTVIWINGYRPGKTMDTEIYINGYSLER